MAGRVPECAQEGLRGGRSGWDVSFSSAACRGKACPPRDTLDREVSSRISTLNQRAKLGKGVLLIKMLRLKLRGHVKAFNTELRNRTGNKYPGATRV